MNRRVITQKLFSGSIARELAAKALKELGRELASAIRAGIPEGYGYMLILRDDSTGSAFFTDAEREDAIATLEDVLVKLKDDAASIPHE